MSRDHSEISQLKNVFNGDFINATVKIIDFGMQSRVYLLILLLDHPIVSFIASGFMFSIY